MDCEFEPVIEVESFLDSLDKEMITSQLSLSSPLVSLVNSKFCKPFFHPLNEDFLMKIFPDNVGLFGLSIGPDCVKSVITEKESSQERVLAQLDKVFDGYINFYRQIPEASHCDYSSEELLAMAEHLKRKIADISRSESSQGNPEEQDPVLKNLIEIFPNHNQESLKAYLQEFKSRGNFSAGVLGLEELIHEILMREAEKPVQPPVRWRFKKVGKLIIFCINRRECRIYPFYPEESNDTGDPKAIHKYVAISQFYKMSSGPSKAVPDLQRTIQSIEYIENDATSQRFEECRRRFKNLISGGDQEVLLFHGTDRANIDSIFNNNFDIEKSPADRPKAMVYGRGIYMSEHPGVCLKYGNVLVLCRVLLGRVSRVDHSFSVGREGQKLSPDQDSREVCQGDFVSMRIIKTADQILPYCVINLNQPSSQRGSTASSLFLNQHRTLTVPPIIPMSSQLRTGPFVPMSSQSALFVHPQHNQPITNLQTLQPVMPGNSGPSFFSGINQSSAISYHQLSTQTQIVPPLNPNPLPINLSAALTNKNPSGASSDLSAAAVTNPVVPGAPSASNSLIQKQDSDSTFSGSLAGQRNSNSQSESKKKEISERLKRLSRGVKKMQEKVGNVDISGSGYSKLKVLLDMMNRIDRNDHSFHCDEILLQKCERAVKNFLQKSQKSKP